ncbi:hypothetical protein MTP09_08055 [Chryseobacterium suipulveris]|uniref:Lipoprotein n=1 Tax=Chryseobacterium suipulveris TaxID=2929800 RepID=A0ABY4BLW6_9FLAO|nr:hypothetical protein [Chryseobacterium suipulveris]UOE39879.1 hypothetical protein MTP09_08055 [Chryseobacterium suipulveris]
MKIFICLYILLLTSCINNNQIFVREIANNKDTNIMVFEIENNSKCNFYLFNPELYLINNKNQTIRTEVIAPTLKKNHQIDSLICKIYDYEFCEKDSIFTKALLLPANQKNILKFKYFLNKRDKINNYTIIFPYNENLKDSKNRIKIRKLKNKLSLLNIFPSYELFIDKINKDF